MNNKHSAVILVIIGTGILISYFHEMGVAVVSAVAGAFAYDALKKFDQ